MRASTLRATLPDGPTPAREQMILDAVESGSVWPPRFHRVDWAVADKRVRVWVATDAIQVGADGDYVRINATQPGADQVAAMMGCVMPTARIADRIWQHAHYKLEPTVLGHGAKMGSTDWMYEHSQLIDHMLAGYPGYGPELIVGNVGKMWCNSTRLWRPDVIQQRRVCNYGWYMLQGWPQYAELYDAADSSAEVLQPLAVAHTAGHTDYSQTVQWVVLRRIEVRRAAGEWAEHDIEAISTDPDWCELLSHEGPLVMRHPLTPCGRGTMWPECYDRPSPGGPTPGGRRGRVIQVAVAGGVAAAAAATAVAIIATGA